MSCDMFGPLDHSILKFSLMYLSGALVVLREFHREVSFSRVQDTYWFPVGDRIAELAPFTIFLDLTKVLNI